MKIIDRIHDILAEFEDARNDDRVLFRRYVTKYHPSAFRCPTCGGTLLDMDELEKVPMPGSIVRKRRVLQNDMEVLPPTKPDVILKRGCYTYCVAKVLVEEGKSIEYARGACRKCPKLDTDDCERLEIHLEGPHRTMAG
jgi:hypothetical protein